MRLASDYHIHTQHSPEPECTGTMEAVSMRALAVGLRSFGVSDHLHARINVPDIEASREGFDRVRPAVDADFHFGVEVSCLRQWDLEENDKAGEQASVYGVHRGGPEDSPLTVYLPAELRQRLRFEYVIGGAHWVLGAPYEQEAVIRSYHRQNMLLAVHPFVDIVAHPWWWMGHWQGADGMYRGLPWLGDFSVIPDAMHREFADAVVAHGKAVEINAGAIFLNPQYPGSFKQQYVKYLKKLKGWGVKFSLGSDAHSVERIGDTLRIREVLEELGLSPESLWRQSGV